MLLRSASIQCTPSTAAPLRAALSTARARAAGGDVRGRHPPPASREPTPPLPSPHPASRAVPGTRPLELPLLEVRVRGHRSTRPVGTGLLPVGLPEALVHVHLTSMRPAAGNATCLADPAMGQRRSGPWWVEASRCPARCGYTSGATAALAGDEPGDDVHGRNAVAPRRGNDAQGGCVRGGVPLGGRSRRFGAAELGRGRRSRRSFPGVCGLFASTSVTGRRTATIPADNGSVDHLVQGPRSGSPGPTSPR